MIPARKSRLFSAWFARDAEHRLKSAFDAIRVRGLDALSSALARGPVLVVTNHTAWWDPLVALYLSARVLRADAFALMDARNLERLPFFSLVGAFGVDLADPADGARAIRYASKLLARENRLVWLFAQGREVPVTARPLGFLPGSGEIARVARRAVVVPGAIRYEMGGTPRPTLWVAFGPPVESPSDPRAGRVAHEESVTRELERIDRALVGGHADDFAVLHVRRQSPWLSLGQAALAWMTRPRMVR